MLTTREQDLAADAGRDHATFAASWVFDGNTSTETYLTCLRMHEAGDPEWWDRFGGGVAGPLSGEFAHHNYTPADLAALIGREDWDDPDASDSIRYDVDEACDLYESAFWQEYEEAVVAQARELAPSEDVDA